MKQIILNHIDVEIWNNLHVQFQPHSDVNIIMGSNGSGKTTFLRNLYLSLAEDKESKDHIIYLPSIDNIALRDKRKTSNALSQELDYYIYEPTLKSKDCLKCLYFTKIISALCCYLEYFSYLYTINQTE